MSRMKEIDDIAQGIADVTLELMEDTIDWQITGQPVEGDEYEMLYTEVMRLAIEKMYKHNTSNDR